MNNENCHVSGQTLKPGQDSVKDNSNLLQRSSVDSFATTASLVIDYSETEMSHQALLSEQSLTTLEPSILPEDVVNVVLEEEEDNEVVFLTEISPSSVLESQPSLESSFILQTDHELLSSSLTSSASRLFESIVGYVSSALNFSGSASSAMIDQIFEDFYEIEDDMEDEGDKCSIRSNFSPQNINIDQAEHNRYDMSGQDNRLPGNMTLIDDGRTNSVCSFGTISLSSQTISESLSFEAQLEPMPTDASEISNYLESLTVFNPRNTFQCPFRDCVDQEGFFLNIESLNHHIQNVHGYLPLEPSNSYFLDIINQPASYTVPMVTTAPFEMIPLSSNMVIQMPQMLSSGLYYHQDQVGHQTSMWPYM